MATVNHGSKRRSRAGDKTKPARLDKRGYEKELERLQVEFVRLQEWIVHKGLKVVVIFEGRDTAGKGGTIKRISEQTNPRVVRTVALSTPTERERTQWYFQRYVATEPSVRGAIHLAHPARANRVQDLVGSQPNSGGQRHLTIIHRLWISLCARYL